MPAAIGRLRLYTLIETCKLNDVDPQAWLADVLKLPDHPAKRIDQLLPWHWKPGQKKKQACGSSLTPSRNCQASCLWSWPNGYRARCRWS